MKLYLDKIYTICIIYLPHVPTNKRDICNIIRQLAPSFLLLGDMNARSPLWNGAVADDGGRIFEDILPNYSISLLNDASATHYHIQTNTSTIDLALCFSDCLIDLDNSVNDSMIAIITQSTLSLRTIKQLENNLNVLILTKQISQCSQLSLKHIYKIMTHKT